MFKSELSACKRAIKRLAVNLLAVFVLVGLSVSTAVAEPEIVAIEGRTMGTSYHIKWVAENAQSVEKTEQIKAEVDQLLLDINQAMSTYISDSELSLFNKLPAGSKVDVSTDLYQILEMAQAISVDSKGAYDITVGPLINLWGFGPDKKVTKAPSDEQIAAIASRVGYQKLRLFGGRSIQKDGNLYVDLSSIAKGYAVDRLASLVASKGYSAYLVEIGGELVTKGLKPGKQPWHIAVESPTSGRVVQKIVRVDDVAVATSGDYRNYFEENGVRYSHIINTKTGKPITHNLASVTVLADNCALADALATAFLAMGVDAAYKYALSHNIEAFFILKSVDGFVEKLTPGFAARIVN